MYILEAIRRKKDPENEGLKEFCVRHICLDIVRDLAILKAKISNEAGVFRIYRTVNYRDPIKAINLLQHKLIDGIENPENLESVWRTCLAQPECKAENLFLIDIDSKDLTNEECLTVLQMNGIKVHEYCLTPNGYHFIVDKFDTTIELPLVDYEVKKDALFFLQMYRP